MSEADVENQTQVAYSVGDIFCLLCCPPWPPRIAEKIAFQPPPPSYDFSFESGKGELVLLEGSHGLSEKDKRRIDCLFGETSRGHKIACVYVKCTQKARYTILFSHGNASDLGHMCQFYSSLGSLTGCNIFSYDYSGYGASDGKPSEKNMYSDIDCAWMTLQSHYGIPPNKIILYGMSLGTVASIDLASRQKVAAVILHSPLTSAIRVIKPNVKRTWCWDAFASIEKVPAITSPVLVIHGTEDEIIPFSHGVAIHERCQLGMNPLWLCGAGHNDIEGYTQYLERLKLFVDIELDQYQENENIKSEDDNTMKLEHQSNEENERKAEEDGNNREPRNPSNTSGEKGNSNNHKNGPTNSEREDDHDINGGSTHINHDKGNHR